MSKIKRSHESGHSKRKSKGLAVKRVVNFRDWMVPFLKTKADVCFRKWSSKRICWSGKIVIRSSEWNWNCRHSLMTVYVLGIRRVRQIVEIWITLLKRGPKVFAAWGPKIIRPWVDSNQDSLIFWKKSVIFSPSDLIFMWRLGLFSYALWQVPNTSRPIFH